MEEDRRLVNESGIFSLWWKWTISFGFVSSLMAFAMFVPKLWLPLVAFGLHLLLLVIIRNNRASSRAVCDLIPMVCSHVLLWSAVIMVAINLMHTHWFDAWTYIEGSPMNKQIPFITILIVAPITAVVAIVVKMAGKSRSFCTDCYIRNGAQSERGFLGTLFSRESNYQLNMLIYISLGISVGVWIYYYYFYINVNMNTPDRFVFRWVPIIIYAMSIGYLAMRYISLWGYYRKVIESNVERHGDSTLLRFLIMCGDQIFLQEPSDVDEKDRDVNQRKEDDKVDTPAKLYVPQRQHVTDHEAGVFFRNISGIHASDIRFLYSSPNFHADCNIFHYACFIDDEAYITRSSYHGQWFTLDQLRRLSIKGRVSGMLNEEILRIYKVCMVWKTYDRNGRRLYPIKNYHPTFRLRDFRSWDVDLNDPQWLFIATNNEDRPFFHIKRLWRKYVNGIGK